MKPTDATTIGQLIAVAADTFGEKAAIEDGDVTISYRDLHVRGLQAARAFIASGLEHGDRVGIWAPNLFEWVIAAIGLQMVGGVLVPLNTRMKGAETAYILEKSGARMLFTMDEFLGARYIDLLLDAMGRGDGRPVAGLPDLERIVSFRSTDSREKTGIGTWDAFLALGQSVSDAEARARADRVEGEDLSDILFTSGTTGKPKGVMTEHAQNLRGFEVWTDVVGLRADDRYLIVNPFFHSFGYKAGWLSCFLRGATCLPQDVFDVPKVLDRIGRDHVSALPGPPTLYQTILAHPEFESYDLSSLRLAVTGAAVVPVDLIIKMREVLAFETVITGYGLTETCGIVTMCRHDDDPETIANTSGRAIPGVDVQCVDPEGNEVARGEPGEVVVRGYNVMRGYFDDEAATTETIDSDGWLHTGDIGVMNERRYLRITDRIKDMFIMGGFNCYPAEIESMLCSHDAVAQVAVIGVPDERMGEVGMAFVVPMPGATLDEKAIIAWCRENMANYKVPRHVSILDELPMNAMGKVTKFVLRERAGELLERSQ
jgi:acyl-CoA synthetase (AMP-forming)/AMP-acid ligase II